MRNGSEQVLLAFKILTHGIGISFPRIPRKHPLQTALGVGINLWNFRPVIADMHEILDPADIDFWSREVSVVGEGRISEFSQVK